MPIEIKELHIRVSVSPTETAEARSHVPTSPGFSGHERGQLVAECVEQVMQILRDRKER